MDAQGAAGTGEAEQTTQTQPEALSPLQEAVRKEMGIETPVAEQPPKPEEKPEEETEAPPETEEQPAEEPAEEPAAAEAEEHEVPAEFPQAAKARIAEEARKRRERTVERDQRTAERDQWKAEAERLNAQLQQARVQFNARQLGKPSEVGEVLDQESLEAERHWTQIRSFTRENPDGAYDVPSGKDPEGNEQRRDYSRAEIINMGMDADQALTALAAKRALLQKERDERVKARVEEAQKVYPDLFKDTTEGREAVGILQRAPWIMQSEEWALDIGDYISGRKMRLAKQGKRGPASAGLSPGAQAILGAPKVAAAPGVIKSRSASGGGPGGRGSGGERVDAKQADEEFYAKGMTSEALEDKIRRKLAASQGGRAGGKQAALV